MSGKNLTVVRGCLEIFREKRDDSIEIPSSIFRDRTLAPLESLSEFLKDEKGMSFHEIALLLNRDDRTIWTCYHRAKKKHEEILQGVSRR